MTWSDLQQRGTPIVRLHQESRGAVISRLARCFDQDSDTIKRRKRGGGPCALIHIGGGSIEREKDGP